MTIPLPTILHPDEVAAFDRGGFGAVLEKRAAEFAFGGNDSSWIAALVGGGNRAALDRPFVKSDWLYACVHAIATNLSTLPLRVYAGPEEKPTTVKAGPLVDLFANPCPGMPRSDWIYRVVLWLLLRGESFSIPIVKGANGALVPATVRPNGLPIAFGIAVPTAVQEVLKPNAAGVASWNIGGFTQTIKVDADVPVHVLYPNPYQQWRGLAPAEVAYAAADAAYQAALFNAEFLKNSGYLGGTISYENTLSPAQRTQSEATFKDKYAGPLKAGRVLILEKGAKWTPNSVSQRDAQFLEGQRFAREAVCAVFGVPPSVVAAQTSNYATKLSDDRCFWERGVLPVARRIADYFNLWLRSVGVLEWIAFDASGVAALQDDLGTSLDRAKKLADLGYSADEINERLKLGMPGGKPWRAEAWTQGAPVPFSSLVQAEAQGADPAAATGATTVADTAMNGAQVVALQGIVKDVAAGDLPADSAVAMVAAAFPSLPPAVVEAIVRPAEKAAAKAPAAPEPGPVPPAHVPGAPAHPPAPGGSVPPADGAVPADAAAPRSAPAVHVRRSKSEALAASAKFARVVVRPHERKVLRVGVRFFRSCKADALRVFDSRAVRAFGPDDLAAIADMRAAWDARIRQFYADPLASVVGDAATATAREIGTTLDVDFNAPRWLKTQRDRLDKLTHVNATTIERARSALVSGLAQSQSTAELRRSLEAVFDGDSSRALLVARTEVGSIASSAREEGYAALGIEKTQWLTANDDVVRESHVLVNDEIVDRGQPYSNGLLYPHDPAAEASDVCNCRCDHVAVL